MPHRSFSKWGQASAPVVGTYKGCRSSYERGKGNWTIYTMLQSDISTLADTIRFRKPIFKYDNIENNNFFPWYFLLVRIAYFYFFGVNLFCLFETFLRLRDQGFNFWEYKRKSSAISVSPVCILRNYRLFYLQRFAIEIPLFKTRWNSSYIISGIC